MTCREMVLVSFLIYINSDDYSMWFDNNEVVELRLRSLDETLEALCNSAKDYKVKGMNTAYQKTKWLFGEGI